jgi:hypothetical protein
MARILHVFLSSLFVLFVLTLLLSGTVSTIVKAVTNTQTTLILSEKVWLFLYFPYFPSLPLTSFLTSFHFTSLHFPSLSSSLFFSHHLTTSPVWPGRVLWQNDETPNVPAFGQSNVEAKATCTASAALTAATARTLKTDSGPDAWTDGQTNSFTDCYTDGPTISFTDGGPLG